MSEKPPLQTSQSEFQKCCQNVIDQLTPETLDKLNESKDEETRIRTLYEVVTKIGIVPDKQRGKSYEGALEGKTAGNGFFAKKDYKNALKTYNKGIVLCPQDSKESRELLTILISNRSATYFELREYKKVLNDIDYLIEIGDYPQHLQYKIWLRKAKCYDALGNERLSSDAFNQAVESLKHSKLDEKAMEAKLKEIDTARKTKVKRVDKHGLELVPSSSPEIFVGGKEYIAAHPKVAFEQDAYQGRFAIAAADIEPGTIIIEENPHCSVVDGEHALKNCQYCFISVEEPIACPLCANVVFCSTICERLANKTFHRVECPVLEVLFRNGASVNCLLAMRIVSQRHYAFFSDKRNKLKDYLKDNCKKNVIKKKNYRFDDYDNVFFLCRNEHLRSKNDLTHYACMSVYLLRLLKAAEYFPFDVEDEVLTNDEAYIGGLILRHLQLLQFNAHEISELINNKKVVLEVGIQARYENVTIGAGLYPTLALFNHSCDPSIVRYNIKNKMVVRTIKPIKSGDIIYENYGPLYMTQSVQERQDILKKNYWFECLCIPCVEIWPTFNEMHENELRIPCATDKCPFVFSVRTEDDPFLTCDYCKQMTSILPAVKGLMILDEILPEAEELFGKGDLDNAMRKFLQGLEVLYKYTRPPHPEIIKVQHRIRVCMIHKGNKSYNYKFLDIV
nr:unnamed protein product [Callosobruchus chinensis]